MARRLRDIVRAEIVRGEFADRAMPSETEMAQRYRVTRNTVREALALLRDEGLVTRVQGAGTFADNVRVAEPFDLQSRYLRSGRIHHEVLAKTFVAATSVVAEMLSVDEGSEVLLLERRSMFQAIPLVLWTTYLPRDLGLDLLDGRDLEGDYVELLESVIGSRLAGSRYSVEATVSDGEVARLLDVPLGSPLLFHERAYLDRAGRVIDYGYGRARGDRIAWDVWRTREGTALVAEESMFNEWLA